MKKKKKDVEEDEEQEEMRCKEIDKWSMRLLVGAFLDLAITFLLLCASAATFVAFKFLDLFGLSLPCSCNGLYGDPTKAHVSKCWQTVLVDRPSDKLSSVRLRVRNRPPFDSMLDKRRNAKWGSQTTLARENGVGCRGSALLAGNGKVKFSVRGKAVRSGLRHRRIGATGQGKFQTVALDGLVLSDEQGMHVAAASSGEVVSITGEVSSLPVGSLAFDGGSSSMDVCVPVGVSVSSRSPYSQTRQTERDAIAADGLKYNDKEEIVFDDNERNTIRVLEKALQDERAARAALYLELEKERSSAATAADEAMAMILRLQEDKAVIEMEAKQFQRMMEEKSAYDSEEMDILKEILLRREREKHFLEKEVEAYRSMISGGEQLNFDVEEVNTSRNMSTIGNNKLEDAESKSEVRHKETPIDSFTLEQESRIPEFNEMESLSQEHRDLAINKFHQNMPSMRIEDDREAQDKELLSLGKGFDPENGIQEVGTSPLVDFLPSEGDDIHQKIATLAGEQHYEVKDMCQGLALERTETSDHDNILSWDQDDAITDGKDMVSSVIDVGPHFHDVHVVNNEYDMNTEVRGNGKAQLLTQSALNEPRSSGSPGISKLKAKEDISRSCSDISIGLPPKSGSGIRPRFSDLRRNSMSVIDCERLKIDNEVLLLRERLRIVQEGREKLSTSAGNKARDKSWLQVLDSRFNYVPDTQRSISLTCEDPTMPMNDDLLTPPPAKDPADMRCWRSVSLGIHRSS